MYDEDFVIAQIDAKFKTINEIRQRGRPPKLPKLEQQYDSKQDFKQNDSNQTPKSRPRKLPLQSRADSKIKVLGAQSHTTKTKAVKKT